MTQRPLTAEEQQALETLNAAVDTAIATRKAWLDAKMHEVSSVKVGDRLYHLHTGREVGKVTKLYRYGSERDFGVNDRSLVIDFEYEVSSNSFDNTSRQGGSWKFGTLEEWRERTIRELELKK